MLGQRRVGAADDLADVAVVRAGGPHLLSGHHPLVTVALGLGLQRCEVAARAGFAEQLAADDVGAIHRAQELFLCLRCPVREDRRRHHAEADGEDALARCLVVGFGGGVRALVRGSEPRSAELGRAGDPTEAGVELLAAPLFFARHHFFFGAARLLLEHRHVVVALAPHERLGCLFTG